MVTKSVRADDATHYMVLGAKEFEAGRLDVRPIACVGIMYFGKPVDFDRVKGDILEKNVRKISRARSVPVIRGGWTYFDQLPMEELDLEYHFAHIKGFDTEAEWKKFLQDLSETGLDYSKPWWRYVVVDKLPDGRSAVVGVCEHAQCDGASQVYSILSLSENKAENPVFLGKKGGRKDPNKKGSGRPKGRRLNPYEIAVAFAKGLSKPFLELVYVDKPNKLKMPPYVFPKKWKFASTNAETEMDTKMFTDISMRVPGCTVNDVMLAVCSLCVASYFKKINDPILKSGEITATFPINTRPRGVDYRTDKYFGNHILIGTLRFPLRKTRVDTLLHFRDEVREISYSPEMPIRSLLLKLLRFVPRPFVIEAIEKGTSNFSIMLSNVLFSLNKLRIFGQELEDVALICESPLALYIGCATYAEKVNCTMVVAEETGCDPEKILPFFKEELIRLHGEVMAREAGYFKKQDKAEAVPVFVLVALLMLGCAILWYFFYPRF